MIDVDYSKIELEEALEQIVGTDTFFSMYESTSLPRICDFASTKVLMAIDSWDTWSHCILVLRKALNDLEDKGCFDYYTKPIYDSEENTEE